jgi:YD repeat-containing protein
MRLTRTACFFVLLASLCCLAPTLPSRTHGAEPRGGIRELIPDKYKERYLAWKADFLSTETGRSQWALYAQDEHFTLTLTVSDEDRHGAGTGKYKWDEEGRLVAATINLGCRIDEGYPNPIYYPVMNALAQGTPPLVTNGHVLAAAKIAHEFGHVKQVASIEGAHYRLQNQLIPAYNQILLSNGRNTRDPRLVALAQQMGGTPVEIWESREYWGEVNAMRYLRDRITDAGEQRALFTRIRRTVELYAKDYVERFEQVTH